FFFQAEDGIRDRNVTGVQTCALPIFNVVVYHGPTGDQVPERSHLEGGFPLRCFQRLSRPNLATRQCHWRDNRNTRGSSTPVLSRSEERRVGKECTAGVAWDRAQKTNA